MKWHRWLFAIPLVGTGIAFIIPVLNASTDPTLSKSFAPIVALCVATMILVDSAQGGWRRVAIGAGSVGSAYLWMAGANDTHPLDLGLPITLLVLFGLAAFMTLAVPFIAFASRKDDPKGQVGDRDRQ